MPIRTSVLAAVHRRALLLATTILLAVAACAAPSTNGRGEAPERDVGTGAPADVATSAPAPAQSQPVKRPPLDLGRGSGKSVDATVEIDRSCNTDAECTVKNVGNCCGHYPACVNVDSPTDPEGVKAQCAKSGMASVCGFPAIASCQCVAGECKGSNKALLE